MTDRLHILGIRHHGPGSAASVERALNDLNPAVVLIEGPIDASELIPYSNLAGMRPPVALLLYPKGYPEAARFFPFAEYSPEWCAMQWATQRGRKVEFIDLPTQSSVVDEIEAARAAVDANTETDEQVDDTEDNNDTADDVTDHYENNDIDADDNVAASIVVDPLNSLAEVAGHSDGESWWNALVEQSVQSPAVFDAIHSVMFELRKATLTDVKSPDAIRDELREAHMRMRIRDALKNQEGTVAVVCGAWHTPALNDIASYTIKADRELLKSAKSTPCNAFWIPWTDQRLAFASGYRAGVVSPGWYRHLWNQYKKPDARSVQTAHWQSRVASLLCQ